MKMYENVENAIKYVLASCEEVRDTHEYSRRFSELSESTANESVKEDMYNARVNALIRQK